MTQGTGHRAQEAGQVFIKFAGSKGLLGGRSNHKTPFNQSVT